MPVAFESSTAFPACVVVLRSVDAAVRESAFCLVTLSAAFFVTLAALVSLVAERASEDFCCATPATPVTAAAANCVKCWKDAVWLWVMWPPPGKVTSASPPTEV